MPGFDRTGPEGEGARTGRQLGRCNPDNEKGPEEIRRGRRGRGLKLRFGNQANTTIKGKVFKRRW